MSHFHLSYTHTRECTPDYTTYPPCPPNGNDYIQTTTRPLPEDEDSGHDDYPYSHPHRPLRTSRTPPNHTPPSRPEHHNTRPEHEATDEAYPKSQQQHVSFEHRGLYPSRVHRHATNIAVSDPEDHDFELRIRIEHPPSPSRRISCRRESRHDVGHCWPAGPLRRGEKWAEKECEWGEGEEEEMRRRSWSRERGEDNSFWRGGEYAKERWSRYWRVESTRTDEVVPLSGWRRRMRAEWEF